MTSVNDILKQMSAVRQPQRKFLAPLVATILALRGRVTSRNLSRYYHDSERTFSRQFRASFAWPDSHQRVRTAALGPRSEPISAQDASFIPKSGKQTFGLGYFFNGCATSGRACPRGSNIPAWTATLRKSKTLRKSWPSSCTRSRSCENALNHFH